MQFLCAGRVFLRGRGVRQEGCIFSKLALNLGQSSCLASWVLELQMFITMLISDMIPWFLEEGQFTGHEAENGSTCYVSRETLPMADSVPGSAHQLFSHKIEKAITIQNHQDEDDLNLTK